MTIEVMKNKKSGKTGGTKKPLELNKVSFTKKFSQKLFSHWLQQLTFLVLADFLLAASKGSRLLFWSQSVKLIRSKFSFPLNGPDSSFLF